MKYLRSGWLVLGLILAVQAAAQTRLEAGIRLGPDGIRGFHLAIGEYFKVPPPEIVVVQKRRIADEELPVVYFLAQQARIAPAAIVDLRLAGKSWMDIVIHYRLAPDIFQVPVAKVDGPPYGRAYGYWKKRGGQPPGKLILKDSEIVDLVNLRFLTDYHRCAPEEVIAQRSRGASFVVINDDLQQHKPGKRDKDKDDDDQGHGHGKSKHKGH